jgi:uncharacterized membrane protein
LYRYVAEKMHIPVWAAVALLVITGVPMGFLIAVPLVYLGP